MLNKIIEFIGADNYMINHWGIFIYTVIASWICMQTSQGSSRIVTQKYDVLIKRIGIVGALISFAGVIYFSATRGFVQDTYAYASEFHWTSNDLSVIPETLKSKEKGVLWNAIQVVFKKFISDDYEVWFAWVAFFHGFAVAKFLSDYSEHFDFSAYLFVTNVTYTWMMNGIRQFTAVCIVLLATKYLFNKCWWLFFIFVGISYYIHDTVIIWVVFYFIVQGKPFNKKVILSIIVAALSVIFLEQFTGLLDTALEGTNHAGASSQFLNDDGVNIITTILYAIPVLLAFFKRKVIKEKEPPRHIEVLINMSCCTMAISLIGSFTSGILIGRLPIYFAIGNYVVLPWIIENCFEAGEKSFIKTGCYLGYFCYLFYCTLM